MRFGFVLLAVLGLAACANKDNNCGNRFLALWPNSTGTYEMQEVALHTLPSPYELSGGAAKVYFENGLTASGYDGDVARPRFTSSDGVCVPMDVESSMAVSVYAQFEKLYEFELKLGTADMLSWPRAVGVNIQMLSSDGLGHNNAHYFSEGDSIAVLPYSLGGLPLGLNHGVIAHEHFHGHFQREVMNRMNPVLEQSRRSGRLSAIDFFFYPLVAGIKPTEEIDNADLKSPRGINNFILRAWNEGLADFFGAIYTENPGFFVESLPMLGSARTLTEEIQLLGSRSDWLAHANAVAAPSQLVSYSYAQGALLARLMYRLANSGVESPHAFLIRTLRRLSAIPDRILPRYDQEVMNMDAIVPILLEGFPESREVCVALEKALNKDTLSWSFEACRD